MAQANWLAEQVDYINPHGSGSVLGDETELQAINQSGIFEAYINTTKSIIGHGLSSAGIVEIIATLLQMKEGQLHPSRNLQEPLESSCEWVRDQSVSHVIKRALKLSIGFGGINTALCLQRI